MLGRSKKGNDAFLRCENCRKVLLAKELERNARVCPHCGKHYRMPAAQRIEETFDEGSFVELDVDLASQDPLEFPEYKEKLHTAIIKTGRQDSIVRGKATLDGTPVAVAVSDFAFMGGSMGAVAGEKITRTLELAAEESMTAIVFTATGGARMQEGLFSLMQMAKTSAACERLSRAGVPFVCVFTDPTMAGVLASYASLADIIIAEPGALVGFAGARVAAQAAAGGKMPDDFQTSEFNLRVGMIDKIVERKDLRRTLSQLISHLGSGKHG